MNKKYWFYLDGYTHYTITKSEVLFYNELNHSILKSESKNILQFCNELCSNQNLSVIEISSQDLKNDELNHFIQDIRTHFMGDLIDQELSVGKPIQFQSKVKINNDIEHLLKNSLVSVPNFITPFLSELNIYINGTCDLDCQFCNYAYKQNICCNKQSGSEISIEHIQKIISQTQTSNLTNINISGGNIFKHSQFNDIISELSELYSNKTLHCHIQHFNTSDKINNCKLRKFAFNFICSKDVSIEEINFTISTCESLGFTYNFHFPIESEEEYFLFENKMNTIDLKNYTIKPLFNHRNGQFFKENIFIDHDDIQESEPEAKDIYTNQKVNTNFFGKINIATDGNVYASFNQNALGNISENSISELLYRELKEGTCWLRTRNQISPCSDCAYQNLCPPISNYEEVMEQYNLCHVKE